MPLIIILALAAGLGPLATWALASVKASWELTQAVDAAADQARIDERRKIQAEQAAQARELLRIADEAEMGVLPTPAERDERQKLCDKSASCRDRKPGGKS